jgi:hypothetical protein
MTGMAAGMGAKAVLAAAGARLKQISPRTWLIIGCVVAALLGALWAHHWYSGQIKAAEKRGSDAAYAHVAEQAQKLTSRANALNGKLAKAFQEKNREENSRIARAADDLRLRGPGAARCTAFPGLSAAARGSQSSDRSGDASVAGLRNEERTDLIALPFAPTIDFGEQHDAFRAEAISWREWYARFSAEWAKWQADSAKARQPAG